MILPVSGCLAVTNMDYWVYQGDVLPASKLLDTQQDAHMHRRADFHRVSHQKDPG